MNTAYLVFHISKILTEYEDSHDIASLHYRSS